MGRHGPGGEDSLPTALFAYWPAGDLLRDSFCHVPKQLHVAYCSADHHFMQVRASTAGWIANLPFNGLSEVIFGSDYMFAALFSPLTEDKAAADFCRRKAFQVLRTGAVSCCAWSFTLCAWQLVGKAFPSLTELQVLTALHPSCAGL